MTMLNVLLYLLLLLAGSAVALILADLHRAEESALEALAELDRGLAAPLAPARAGCSRSPVPAGHGLAARTTAGQAAGRTLCFAQPERASAFITLAGLPAAPAATGASAAASGPSFDFALASVPRAAAPTQERGPAVSGQPSMNDSRDWNCCA